MVRVRDGVWQVGHCARFSAERPRGCAAWAPFLRPLSAEQPSLCLSPRYYFPLARSAVWFESCRSSDLIVRICHLEFVGAKRLVAVMNFIRCGRAFGAVRR